LFGRPESGIFLVGCSVFASTTYSVCSASLLKYSQRPSGDAAAPWLIGTLVTSPAMRLVAGSIRWMLFVLPEFV
jgi:hypothetical protein